jgi:hypothetical protein
MPEKSSCEVFDAAETVPEKVIKPTNIEVTINVENVMARSFLLVDIGESPGLGISPDTAILVATGPKLGVSRRLQLVDFAENIRH